MNKNIWRDKAALKYSLAAQFLLDNHLGNIDVADFENFINKYIFIVGDGHVLAYLKFKADEEKKRKKE